MQRQYEGKITFPTMASYALWKAEFLGQLSDGMWENTRPLDHWKFWHTLEPVYEKDISLVEAQFPWKCSKFRYDFNRLIPIVGDRMLSVCKMSQIDLRQEVLRAVAYMPSNMREWLELKAISSSYLLSDPKRYIGDSMVLISQEMAAMFYESPFTIQDLRKEIKLVREVMISIER